MDDEAEVIEGSLLLDIEADALLGLGFDAIRQVQMDHIAGMLEIPTLSASVGGLCAIAAELGTANTAAATRGTKARITAAPGRRRGC